MNLLNNPAKQYEKNIALLILALYVLFSVAFSFSPIFEGSDELEHYRYVRYLALTLSLPDPFSQVRGEYYHAPLYYMAAAPLAMIFRGNDFAEVDGRRNPFYPYLFGIPGNDNKNRFLHSRREAFPYAGSDTALAVHVIRLLSVVLGLGTLLTCKAIFALLWPERADRKLLALSAAAFMPQFIYMSSTINNDNLLYLTVTLSLWLLLLLVRDGLSWGRAILLGIVMGAAVLAKANAVVLLLPFGLTLLLRRCLWRIAPLILILVALIAGWWYVRNWILYGDPLDKNAWLTTWAGEATANGAFVWQIGQARLPFAYQTFWARFGEGQIPVAQPIYVFFNALTLVTLTGVAAQIIQYGWKVLPSWNRSVRSLIAHDYLKLSYAAILGIFGIVWIFLLAYLAGTAWSGNQGRYLLPCLAVWAALIAIGLDTWTPQRLRWPVAVGEAFVLAIIAAICTFGYFLPAWQVQAAPAQIEHPLAFHYADAAELIGIWPFRTTARPGEIVHINLYWRALRPASRGLLSYLHSVDSDVIRRDSYPATGNLLASDWQAGETWTESYVVEVPSSAAAQTVYSLTAGLFDSESKATLPSTNSQGKSIFPVVGELIINGAAQPRMAAPYRLGNIAVDVPKVQRTGNTLTVCIKMQLQGQPLDTNYTLFIHALPDMNSASQPLYQADVQPHGGKYPTSMWSPDEIIEDCVPLAVGRVPIPWLALGLYDAKTGQRLPVNGPDGSTDNRILIPGT